jgi:putative PEP-CTERM system TPR-repeat lipoprotein
MRFDPLRPAAPVLQRLALAALLTLSIGPLAHAASDDKASRYYEDALGRYEKNDVKGAIIQLKNALQIDKSLLPVQVLLGKALLANGEAVAAEVAFNEALRLGVNRAEVAVPLAQAVIAQGKQQFVVQNAQFNPNGLPPAVQVRLLVLRSSAYSDLGDPTRALQALDEARAIDASGPDVWVAEVPVRIRTREFREAGAAIAKASAIAPNSAEVWYQKGALAHVTGDLGGAKAAYDRALQIDAKHVEARVARAGLEIDLGRIDEANADIAELQRLSPREPRGAYMRALLAERSGNAAAARTSLSEVTALIDPVPIDFIRYRPQLLMLGGLAHFGLQEPEKAKPYLESFQRVSPNSPVAKLLAQIYLAEPSYDRAVELLDGYLKAHPGDAQAMTLLASAHMAQGRNAKAAALMQDALKSRDSPEFHAVLGLSLLGGGQPANAVAELESAFAKDPGQIQAGTALVGLYLRNKQPEKALAISQKLVQLQPRNAAMQNLLGMAKAQTGDTTGARAAFEQAIQLDPKMAQPKLNLARLDTLTKAYDSAQARLTAILAADAKNVDALLEMAALSERRGMLDDAQRWLQKAADAAPPRELRPHFALVDFNLRNNRAPAALEAAKVLASKAPEDLAVLLAVARAQLVNRDVAGAQTTLGNATRLANFDPAVQLEIASMQVAAGNLTGAQYSLEKALSDRPDNLPAQALMVDVALRQGDPARAEALARQIVQANPKRAIGYSLLGDIATSKSQNAAAVDAYRRAQQAEPSTETLLRLANASARQDPKAATRLVEQWIAAHPKDAAARRMLADAYARSGNNAGARTAYLDLLQSFPDDAELLNNLANVLLQMKDPQASTYAERALTKSPGSPLVLDTAGWIAFQGGQTDRALQLLRDARLRDPNNPDIRYHLAAVLAKTGRRSEAREELEAAVANGRTFDSGQDAQALLATLK